MIRSRWIAGSVCFLFAALAVGDSPGLQAQSSPLPQKGGEKRVYPIDLPTVLRLAGEQNLDIQIAREKLAEARANHASAVELFFPWISPGLAYRRHDNLVQGTEGNIENVHKHSYSPGATVAVQVDIGNAIYRALETHQLVKATDRALDAQRQEIILAAAQGYFDLAKAQAAVGVAEEAVKISQDYEQQLHHAVEAGIAFRGDELRAQVQTRKNQLALHQADEQRRIASARLAQTLHLDATVDLSTPHADPIPMSFAPPDTTLGGLVQQALVSRPEFQQGQAFISAAQNAKDSALYGSLVPTISAQAFVGGLGGGKRDGPSQFGASEDYFAGLSWRIGPGGLFDFGRVRAAQARIQNARLIAEKVRDEIVRQVVEAHARAQSLADQISTARQALVSAEEALRLGRGRKEYGVGIVLEVIQAEQDLTRARNDYLNAVAEYNKVQYALMKAVGQMSASPFK